MASSTGKVAAYVVLTLTYAFAGGSQLLFGVFLLFGSLHIVNLGGSAATVLGVDTGLSLVFFVQHSVMVRKRFRKQLARFLPAHYNPAFYAIVSGATLFFVVICWQESAHILVALHGPVRWLFRVVFLLGVAGMAWGVRSLLGFDAFGIRHIRYYLRGRTPRPQPFTVRGPYRWVRHPLYLFTLMMIWSCPDLTLDRLMFNLLWTAWIVAGTILEERDLLEDLGDDYRAYQRQVPMLIPWRLRPVRTIDTTTT